MTVYVDHLYYPMVVGHRIVEMSGADIKRANFNEPITITKEMWEELMERLESIEKAISDVRRS